MPGFMELGILSSQRSREVTGLRDGGDESGVTVSCKVCLKTLNSYLTVATGFVGKFLVF